MCKVVRGKVSVWMNDLTIILKHNIMKMYLYCLCFKWTNYLKACEGGGGGYGY